MSENLRPDALSITMEPRQVRNALQSPILDRKVPETKHHGKRLSTLKRHQLDRRPVQVTTRREISHQKHRRLQQVPLNQQNHRVPHQTDLFRLIDYADRPGHFQHPTEEKAHHQRT